ncbi:hypothetical protein BFL36_05560 [Clavibacter michiganensis]|uniref:Uncharacterized protein n=1 Tax=Clavibacter michiganensis TaxID=28447 RepID=A0A251YLV0_9MICO|nr:hypothetical protein [Clavibacter michiganensis]OUE25008.1 hypothetical protein BFL36_05560 [Clavibacter michiganensis]
MRIATVVQALADGAGAAGLVLFALILTDIGTPSLALTGLALLTLSLVVRVAAVVQVRRGLDRVMTGRGSWRWWIRALWVVQAVAVVAGLVLAHSSFGAAASGVLAGAVVAVASAALAGGAARRPGRPAGFVDSAAVTAYA